MTTLSEPCEIHRCDRCGERTRHIVVLVPRDHTQDIMPKDPRKAFWQAFRASLLTNTVFGDKLAYLDPQCATSYLRTLRRDLSRVLSPVPSAM